MSTINQAMVFSAGFGKRLAPLTDTLPKPLIRIGNSTLLDHALDQLETVGVDNIVVNTHHLATKIHDHLKERPSIHISYEEELLETGGGALKVIDRFNNAPFFGVNSDVWWRNGPVSALKRLQEAWDPHYMDVLLLLTPREHTIYLEGDGDYFINDDFTLRYRRENEKAPMIYTGIQVLHPDAFKDCDVLGEKFSLKKIYDRVEAQGRLYGLIHDNISIDISTPLGLKDLYTHL